MSDGQHKPDARKNQSGRDNKMAKRNKNLTSALPDRAKLRRIEEDTAHRLQTERIARADGRNPNAPNFKYGMDVMAAIISLRRDGKTWAEITQLGHIGTIKLPKERKTIDLIRDTNPEFNEALRRARSDFERDIVERGVGKIDKISSVPGLKGAAKSRALAEHARVALALGRQALPDDYGGGQDQGAEVIVFETHGGWKPAEMAKTDDGQDIGQGVDAKEAREKWKKLRAEAEEA